MSERTVTPVRWSALTPGMPMRLNRLRFAAGDAGSAGTAGGDAAAAAQAATDAATAAAAQATTDAATAAAAQAATEAAAATEATNVKGLPQWAQTLIHDTREEAAGHRTKATEAATKATEAAAAQQSTLDKLAIALGLKTEDDGKPDAAALTAQVTAAQAAARESVVQLAVFKAAGPAGANPIALLDRNSFTKALVGLDPATADFTTKVTAAITAALTADPTLKTVQATGASSVDHAGGTGEGTKPLTLAAAVQQHYGA